MSKNYRILLACIIGIFALITGLMMWRYWFILPDSNYLLALGKNIVTGNGLTISGGAHFRYPPAYGTISGLLWLLVGNLQASAHIVSLLSGIAAIIIVYVYTSNEYNRETGLLAALLVGINPLFCRISSAPLGESFFSLGYAVYILLIFKLLKKPNWWMSMLAGIVASMVYLTRAEGFLILPLGFIMLLIAWWRAKFQAWTIIVSLLSLVIGWMFLGFPYLLFLREHLGGWALSGKITQNIERVSEAIYVGDYESLRQSSLHEHETHGLIPYLIENFPRVSQRYIHFTWSALKMALVRSWPVLIPYLWFIWLSVKDGSRRGWHFIAMAFPLVVYPLAHIEIRYVTPYFIAFAPVIAWGMKMVIEKFPKAEKQPALGTSLVIAVFAMMFIGCIYDVYRTQEPPYEHRILADWMAENLDDAKTARLSSRFAYVNFYLGNEDFRYIPVAETIEETLDLARERHIDYIVYSKRLTADVRPALAPLSDPANVVDGMELVIKLDPPDVPETVILYRILPETFE